MNIEEVKSCFWLMWFDGYLKWDVVVKDSVDVCSVLFDFLVVLCDVVVCFGVLELVVFSFIIVWVCV